jgi:hypothetical protein
MKWHITTEQYNELSNKERGVAESYFRCQGLPKPNRRANFWEIGRMIDFLFEAALLDKSLESTSPKRALIDIYGFNLSGTLREEWCDKLWNKVKQVLAEEVNQYPFNLRI